MSNDDTPAFPRIAVACGGTGGHVFPGLAVAKILVARGCKVQLLISEKEIDQTAVRGCADMEISTIPAVGLTRGSSFRFVAGLAKSYRDVRRMFAAQPVAAVLAMGGFTSAAPVFAGKRAGAHIFIHEGNSIPGRANRWLARWVEEAYCGFSETVPRLRSRSTLHTGMPVRAEFHPRSPAECRQALGLDVGNPVVLVMGGSQGARTLNELAMATALQLQQCVPGIQMLHLAGFSDYETVERAYTASGIRCLVRPFVEETYLWIGAADVALTRSGASSLAELGAMQIPAVLVPLPWAVDDHQRHNALAVERCGGGVLVEQKNASPDAVARILTAIFQDRVRAERMRKASSPLMPAEAAGLVAARIMSALSTGQQTVRQPKAQPGVRYSKHSSAFT